MLVDEQGFQVGTRHRRMAPYRTMVSLPEGDGATGDGAYIQGSSGDAEFVIMRAYVPLDEDDARKELSAYLVGRSDGDRLGELVVYRPPSSNFDGPALAEERIRNDEAVASLQTLLSQRGSSVLFGELLLVPIEDSILYVRPLYVQAEGDSTVPELERVIVAVGEQVVMADSLQQALEELTGASLVDLFRGISTGVDTDTDTDTDATGTGSDSSDVVSLDALPLDTDGSIGTESPVYDNLADLVAELARLQAASAAAMSEDPADWAEFGRIQARMQDLVEDLAG
jgi:uncharacterized membrane protein (UPF0182 family)